VAEIFRTPDNEHIFQAGNAKNLAKFFTLLEQNMLVNRTACSEMNGLLDGNLWRHAFSFLGTGISLEGGNKVCTKIGFLGDPSCDAGWIKHDAMNYVAVVLNVIDKIGPGGPITKARIKLEACL
jgi:hypothetical protein